MILSHPDIDRQALRTKASGEYNLSLGQLWEGILAANLTALGLPTYSPQQQFISADNHKDDREHGKCRLKYIQPTGQKLICRSQHFDSKLLQPHQRDLLVKIGKVKRLSVEVKALQPAAFRQHMIQVGCCPKYDLKQFRIDALILINQETSEAFVAPEQDTWQRQKGADGKMCYVVARLLLTPLEAWIDFVKDSLMEKP